MSFSHIYMHLTATTVKTLVFTVIPGSSLKSFCRKHHSFLHRPLLAHFLFLLLDLCQDFREMEPHSRLFQAGSWVKLIANVSIPISTQFYAASSYTAL